MKRAKNGYMIIGVHFTDGTTANYTTQILRYLRQDPQVKDIFDPDTGQVIWHKG